MLLLDINLKRVCHRHGPIFAQRDSHFDQCLLHGVENVVLGLKLFRVLLVLLREIHRVLFITLKLWFIKDPLANCITPLERHGDMVWISI